MMHLIIVCFLVMSSVVPAAELKHFFFHRGKSVNKLLFFMSKKPQFTTTEQAVLLENCTFTANQLAGLKKKLAPVAQLFTLSVRSDALIFTKQKASVSFSLQEIVSDRFGTGIMLVASTVQAPVTKQHKKNCIVIDPGHGGTDSGAKTAEGVCEKDISLAVSKLLMEELIERGYRIKMTRLGDTKIELDERTAKANLLEADLLISLHVDSCNRTEKEGISIRIPSQLPLLVSGKQAPFEQAEKKRILASSSCAALLKERLSKEKDFFGAKQIRVATDPFQVLVGAEMAAMLIEMGFLSHKEEAKQLQNQLYQKKFAVCIADTVDSYYKSNTLYKSGKQRSRYDTRST
jgi:N-acetylmuramoyl-L-alanine amidase